MLYKGVNICMKFYVTVASYRNNLLSSFVCFLPLLAQNYGVQKKTPYEKQNLVSVTTTQRRKCRVQAAAAAEEEEEEERIFDGNIAV